MKLKRYLIVLLGIVFFACQDDDQQFGDITAPSNIEINAEIIGADDENPNGDGSGEVVFTAQADNAISYGFVYESNKKNAPSGSASFIFSTLGVNTYTVTAIAYGKGGVSSSKTIDIDVLATYEPPQELLEKLYGDGSKSWRVKSSAPNHFGLGPVGGDFPPAFYGANPNDKAGVGMYDDRYVFNQDGTFTLITNVNNEDTSGTIVGRAAYIDQLGSSGGTPNGDDIENLPLDDFQTSWQLINPGGVETISFTGLGFIGYYTGTHNYEIYDRSQPNEMTLRITDGNAEFDWWFIITSEPVGSTDDDSNQLETEFENLVLEKEFDVAGAPDPNFWNLEIGNGNNGWGNEELQYYTEDNVIIEDGLLKITAKREPTSGFDFSSTRMTTLDNFSYEYGRIEVRAKLPEGGGTWPAIWMLGDNFPDVGWPETGEIDIMEHRGNEQDVIHGSLHLPGNSAGNAITEKTTVEGVSEEFNNYTVEWSEDRILFAVNGEVYHEFQNNSDTPFNKPFFLILNVAMGGTFGGDVDPDFSESTMEIDYIRVYQ